jgi:hypothetical protein
MVKQKSKEQLLKDIDTERRRLEKNLFTLSEEDMMLPGVLGTWSVKDILVHIVAWEKLFLDWYQAGIRGSCPDITPVGMSKKAIDALNQDIYEKNRSRSLEDVLSDFRTSYQQTLTTIKAIPEEDMFIRGRFEWTGKLTLADYIAGNTCNHYAWAKLMIRKRARSKIT